ncbi:hypothetical protein [Actinoallomurus sp. NPDC050550]|uniref:hypothetical protein n=1 Tax=Actinoallomurus sp. NPDC050550 TaxID=3154937 RepID=UPI003400A559
MTTDLRPDLESLRAAVTAFGGFTGADRASAALALATAPRPDLTVPAHRRALLAWLNSWGCRIRYPRPGEPDLFDLSVGAWWTRRRHALPDEDTALSALTDEAIAELGECYEDLAAAQVGSPARPRALGPTAASKLLHALRPKALMPWDEAIADHLHGARDAAAYTAHQRLGRAWATGLLAEAGVDEEELADRLGRPGRPLAKMLDDYCYLRFTRLESG